MPRPGSMRVKLDQSYLGGPTNPTADRALANVAGAQPVFTDSLPPPDHVWIPQLYQTHDLLATARISRLSKVKVKQILTEQGIETRPQGGQTKADKANRSPG